ncbi:transcriptional regulator NrdR [Marinisporobacter balticus]|uniref:Transcriptional repressor NrdR n=1 Tax=Marinisporobacter balticus TaxID=2018667 RepID=A0A4R2KXG8_9FIRM|nr:transcriptional regulator NrdR [Marinisporobacter balticus]TCO79291.1 transcriptional repressor NrdR [Marinisporobacter balticus]
MNCPFCEYFDTKVVDSRPTEEGQTIRRRRECSKCKKRFTTYEKIEEIPLIVIKKDRNREAYNRNKILNGIIRACEKRPVPVKDIENIIDHIEKDMHNTMEKEIKSTYIGELVMNHLKDLDEVAYVRFASVYRQFKDINTFMEELRKILNEK